MKKKIITIKPDALTKATKAYAVSLSLLEQSQIQFEKNQNKQLELDKESLQQLREFTKITINFSESLMKD